MIQAKIVADSLNEFGDRLTTLLVTFPRYILAELNTHRVLSKNSASSRAIPFNKMVESVEKYPFVPYAWQKDHKGMQGTEYFNTSDLLPHANWLDAKDKAVNIATRLNEINVTKQLANRLLEPFMWHTVLISGTEWENFFKLRCPQYWYEPEDILFRSRKDYIKYWEHNFGDTLASGLPQLNDTLDWLKLNKGQADIHMMFLAEAIWDAMNESKPNQLKAGEWHIPYNNKIPYEPGIPLDVDRIKVATGMAARASYTVVGDEKEVSYETLIGIHDKMVAANPFHASPFEHCALTMGKDDLDKYFKVENGIVEAGWCRNFKGFIQYRAILEQQR